MLCYVVDIWMDGWVDFWMKWWKSHCHHRCHHLHCRHWRHRRRLLSSSSSVAPFGRALQSYLSNLGQGRMTSVSGAVRVEGDAGVCGLFINSLKLKLMKWWMELSFFSHVLTNETVFDEELPCAFDISFKSKRKWWWFHHYFISTWGFSPAFSEPRTWMLFGSACCFTYFSLTRLDLYNHRRKEKHLLEHAREISSDVLGLCDFFCGQPHRWLSHLSRDLCTWKRHYVQPLRHILSLL